MTNFSPQFIEWSKKRAKRIHQEIPIARVLYDYGYHVHADLSEVHEQQFSCDLHGDGTDNKPSARVYPATYSWYCWGCGQSRDAISTIRDKESLKFHEACKFPERKYGLSPMPNSSGMFDNNPDELDKADFELHKREVTFNTEAYRVNRFLEIHQKDRTIPMSVILSFWEAFDCICWKVNRKHWDEKTGLFGLAMLITKVTKIVRSLYAQEEDESDYDW